MVEQILLLFYLVLLFAPNVFGLDISTSVSSPNGGFEVGQSATLIWSVKYDENMRSKMTFLSIQDGAEEVEIASNVDGVNETMLALYFGDGANISITAYTVEVEFHSLSYADKFELACTAYGGTLLEPPKKVVKKMAVEDVKGGVSQCGCMAEEQYTFPLGKSSFTFNLCGNPQPVLQYTVAGKTHTAKSELVDDAVKMYKYHIDMPYLTAQQCGEKIQFNAAGHRPWKNESKFLVKYIPSSVGGFEFIKNVSQQQQNCTIFRMQDDNHGDCILTYNIYVYDKSNQTVLLDSFIGITEHEIEKCYDNETLFDRIWFANVEASLMGLTGPRLNEPMMRTLLIEGVAPTTPTPTPTTVTVTNSSSTITVSIKPTAVINDQHSSTPSLWMQYYTPIILALIIVLLLILIFVVHFLRKRHSRLPLDEEVVLNYEVDTKKGSYDL